MTYAIKDSYKMGVGAGGRNKFSLKARLSPLFSPLGQRPTLWRWRIRVTRQAIRGVDRKKLSFPKRM